MRRSNCRRRSATDRTRVRACRRGTVASMSNKVQQSPLDAKLAAIQGMLAEGNTHILNSATDKPLHEVSADMMRAQTLFVQAIATTMHLEMEARLHNAVAWQKVVTNSNYGKSAYPSDAGKSRRWWNRG